MDKVIPAKCRVLLTGSKLRLCIHILGITSVLTLATVQNGLGDLFRIISKSINFHNFTVN